MANRRSTARDLAQIAIFAALIAALGLPGSITIGSTGVPITLQTLGIMLTGGILGARKGFLAVAVFLVLTTAGLPLLAGGRGGLGIWAGPSAGYLVGWLVGVVVIGLLTAPILPRYPLWQGIVHQPARRRAGHLPVRGHLAGHPDRLGPRGHRRVRRSCLVTCSRRSSPRWWSSRCTGPIPA